MRRTVGVLVVLLCVAVAAPAVAQVQTGSILVRVTDEQGGVLPGVTVTISSPVLVSGTMIATTDSGGVHRFPSLVPGTYSVKLEIQNFQTVVHPNIVVLVGQTTPVELALKIAQVSETVTVAGESPTVDTTSANVNVNLSEQLLQKTPGGRDIWALVEYKVPSLLITRPDVGGTSGGLQGVYNARGTTTAQNSQFLNGINVGDPAAIGAAGYYYDFDAFDDIQVSTGAHDITVPTSGVFLNMVTKSGGDHWSGGTTFAWEGKKTQSGNIDANLLKYGFLPQTNVVDFVSDVNVTGGGPLIANKLRMFGSFRDWRVHVNVPAAFSTTVLDQTNITSGLVNLTYQVNQDNKVTGFFSRQRYNKPNRFLNSSSVSVKDSTVDEEDIFNVFQGLWNSIFSNNFFVDARMGYNTILFPTYQNTKTETLFDTATSIRTRNFNTNTVRHRPRLQANATAQYYVDHALGGRHEFKFGFDHAHAAGRVDTTRVDEVEPTYSSATGLAQTVTLFGGPFQTKTTVDVTSLFAQDSYSIRRLTVTGGVRWERLEGYLPAQSSPTPVWAASGIGGFAGLKRDFPAVRNVVLWHTIGPRAAAAFDVTGNGLTAIKASAARYYYVISTGGNPLDAVNPNANYQEQYTWNDANKDLFFQAGEQTGTPIITSGTTTKVDSNFERPFTDEFTAGVDRQLMPALKLSVIYTYRREKRQQGTINPTGAWATTLTSRADSGPDGVAATADDGTFTFFDRLSATNQTLVTNDPTSTQTYKGLEVTATKRLTNRWQMLAGVTFAHTTWHDFSLPNLATPNPNSAININGPITGQVGDRPTLFKLTGTYILPIQDIALSANFRSQSGIAVTRQVNTRLTVGGTTNVNVEPAGSHRINALTTLDLRVAKTIRFGSTPRSLEAAVDIYNVSNANTVWDVRTLSGTLNFRQNGDPNGAINVLPQFLSPAQVLAPRIVRFSGQFRF